MKTTPANKKSFFVYIITLSFFLQSCFSFKPISANSYIVNRNGVQTVVVKKPQIKRRASAFSWIGSIALVPFYGVGLIPVIYCASSGSKTDVESDEDAQKWVKLYNKKYKVDYIVVPTNLSRSVVKKTDGSIGSSKWVDIKDYSMMCMISKNAGSMYYAQSPEDITCYEKMFPGSEYTDGFVERTGTFADEATINCLINNYPNNPKIGIAKKRYLLMSKNYNEFNLRLAQFNTKNIYLSKDEVLKQASSFIIKLPIYKDLIDFNNRYGAGTIYDDTLFEKVAQTCFPHELEKLINMYPSSKYRESAILILFNKTADLNTLKRYAGVYTNSKHYDTLLKKIEKEEGYMNAHENSFKLSGDKNKSYPVTQIGNYYLMTVNLDVTHFRNGDAIKRIETDEEWVRAYKNETPAYCDHPMGSSYGKLYNKYAFEDARELAPTGWRRPSETEWDAIIKEMKITQREDFWLMKGGVKFHTGDFKLFDHGAFYWCQSEGITNLLLNEFALFRNNNHLSKSRYAKDFLGKLNAETEANYHYRNDYGELDVYAMSRGAGLSVRLIKE